MQQTFAVNNDWRIERAWFICMRFASSVSYRFETKSIWTTTYADVHIERKTISHSCVRILNLCLGDTSHGSDHFISPLCFEFSNFDSSAADDGIMNIHFSHNFLDFIIQWIFSFIHVSVVVIARVVLWCIRHNNWSGPKVGRLFACTATGNWIDSRHTSNGQCNRYRSTSGWRRIVGNCIGRARIEIGRRTISWCDRRSAGRCGQQSQLFERVLAWIGRSMESFGWCTVLECTVSWLWSVAWPMAVAVQYKLHRKWHQVSLNRLRSSIRWILIRFSFRTER